MHAEDVGLPLFHNLINIGQVKSEKKCEIFGYFMKKLLLCTLFCGSSCKAVKNDALSSDMRLRWRPQSESEKK